jgi:hypothetical protein
VAEPGQPEAATGSVPYGDFGQAEPESKVAAKDGKLEQIKDLYLTAEAIGDDALSQYFQQVSERQRQLIRDYFNDPIADGAQGQPPA